MWVHISPSKVENEFFVHGKHVCECLYLEQIINWLVYQILLWFLEVGCAPHEYPFWYLDTLFGKHKIYFFPESINLKFFFIFKKVCCILLHIWMVFAWTLQIAVTLKSMQQEIAAKPESPEVQ